jgi:hypothetical protein
MAINKTTRLVVGISATVALAFGIGMSTSSSGSIEPAAEPSATSVQTTPSPAPEAVAAHRTARICASVMRVHPSDFDEDGWFSGPSGVYMHPGNSIVIRIDPYLHPHPTRAGAFYNYTQGAAADTQLREALGTRCPAQLTRLDEMVAAARANAAATKAAADAKEAKEKAAEARIEKAVKAGTLIADDGSYLVGDEVKAGTWRTVTKGLIEDCYWERTSGSGNIIDNHFGTSTRMTVTVRSGEIFKTQDCGDWERVG